MRTTILTALVVGITITLMSFGAVSDVEARFQQGNFLLDGRTAASFTNTEVSNGGDVEQDVFNIAIRGRSLLTQSVYLGGTAAYSDIDIEVSGNGVDFGGDSTEGRMVGNVGYLFTPTQPTSPYVGAEFGFLHLDLGDEDDTEFLWGGEVGIISHLSQRLFFDGSLAYRQATGFEFSGEEFDIDQFQVDLGLGYRF